MEWEFPVGIRRNTDVCGSGFDLITKRDDTHMTLHSIGVTILPFSRALD